MFEFVISTAFKWSQSRKSQFNWKETKQTDFAYHMNCDQCIYIRKVDTIRYSIAEQQRKRREENDDDEKSIEQ